MNFKTFLAAAAVTALAVPAFAQPPAAPAATPPAAAGLAALAAGGTPTDEQRMAAFEASDKDKDGKLSPDEYKAVLVALGQDPMLFDFLWPTRDANEDGFVSKEEFTPPPALQ